MACYWPLNCRVSWRLRYNFLLLKLTLLMYSCGAADTYQVDGHLITKKAYWNQENTLFFCFFFNNQCRIWFLFVNKTNMISFHFVSRQVTGSFTRHAENDNEIREQASTRDARLRSRRSQVSGTVYSASRSTGVSGHVRRRRPRLESLFRIGFGKTCF